MTGFGDNAWEVGQRLESRVLAAIECACNTNSESRAWRVAKVL